MSGNYDNTNSGALFKNDRKESDKHPDYRGTLNVDGKEFWVSSWIKTSKAGAKFMSLSVQPKLQSDRSSPPTGGHSDRRQARDEFNDDIPW